MSGNGESSVGADREPVELEVVRDALRQLALLVVAAVRVGSRLRSGAV